MRKASSVFYLITGIASLIGLVLLVVFGVLAVTTYKEAPTEEEQINMLASGIVMFVFAVIECFAMFVGFHGHKLNKKGSPRIGFHIFSLVLGVIGEPFLILAGVFGIVGASRK